MRLVSLRKAQDNIHKYVAVVEQDTGRQRTIRFGAAGMSDFTKNKDTARKERYLERHKRNEDWNDPLTAGFWSRWLLWNKPTISASLADIRERFGL
jgi:hypothetical protein